ncbi:glutamine ABC transporter periplasmic protein [bacterium BMS3Abin14]|nr:glutamine ABC transporter periplasmic protein [bacterium BMS3Abin14]
MRTRILIIALLLCFFSAAEAQNKMILNTADEPPESTDSLNGISDRVVKETFRRIGVGLRIVRLPSERALQNANEGIEDGNYARVGGLIGQLYPNLIQVPEPITQFQFVAFSKKSDFRPAGWGSLRPFHVGIVTGWKILEKNIQQTKSLTRVNNSEILFKMLEAERIEVAVFDLQQGLFIIKKLGLSDIKPISSPLSIQDMYIYLHKEHRAIVPRLTEALKRMKKDGTYRKIVSDWPKIPSLSGFSSLFS